MIGWFGRKSAPERPPFVPAWLTGEGEQGGFAKGYQAQFDEVYRRNPVGLRAVRLVAGLVGGLPLFGSEKAVELVKADALLERAAANLLLHGNAYARLLTDSNDRPADLQLMRPERVSVASGADGWPAAYLYRGGGQAVRIARHDALRRRQVAHLKSLDPGDDHSYSVSFAVALSSRPIRQVGRIWADGKLIRGAGGDFKVKTRFRLGPGDEDQAIDPLIASVESLEQTPAYRGLALAIFEDLALAEFGNRIPVLTFEVVADEADVSIASLLADASGGLIDCADERPIPGFAAHGSSIGDGLHDLIELTGVDLTEQDGLLVTPGALAFEQLDATELGCDGDGEARPETEHIRASSAERPAALSLTYYDPDRDYQAGQMRSSGGGVGNRDERIELPAVLTAAQAKQLVEEAFARRWRIGDRLKLRLPPTRMAMRPGQLIRIPGIGQAWTARSISIDGMAVAIEAEAAPTSVPALPAAAGRAATQPDIPVGRTDLALFELPTFGDTPDSSVKVYLAGSNAGLWKPVPVELALGDAPLAAVALPRRAIIGVAKSALDPSVSSGLDELSNVVVQLTNPIQLLLNADQAALMGGANLAILGDELIQFGEAAQLGAGRFRLSKLLRARRGTEWAASGHAVGDRFCMIDSATVRTIELPPSAVGATLKSTAHGIGDAAPLPILTHIISGESLRPPSEAG